MKELIKKCVAECIGTFALVFFAVGTACVTQNIVAIALSFGLVIVVMAYSVGSISGCHLNPAVSVAMYTMGKIDLKTFLGYVIAQFAGAILGAFCIYSAIRMPFPPDYHMTAFGVNLLISREYSVGSVISSFFFEFILTLVFVYVIIHSVSSESIGNKAGLYIGATLVLVHLLGINLTGTSVNPARSFGPALVSLFFGNSADAIAQVWVFILAPLGGGVLAAFLYKFFHTKTDEGELNEYIKEIEAKREEKKKKKELRALNKSEKDSAKKSSEKNKKPQPQDEEEYEDGEYEDDDEEYDDDEYEDDDEEYEDEEDDKE